MKNIFILIFSVFFWFILMTDGSIDAEDKRVFYTSQAECEALTQKKCEFSMCDYIPPGKTYKEVCDNHPGKTWQATFSQDQNAMISDQSCDALRQCPDGYSCYGFQGIGLRCAPYGDPCSYFQCPENTHCILTASYPAQVHCAEKTSDPSPIPGDYTLLWRVCQESDECEAIPTYCGGWTTVNMKYKVEARQFFEDKSAVKACREGKSDQPTPSCVNGFCEPSSVWPDLHLERKLDVNVPGISKTFKRDRLN